MPCTHCGGPKILARGYCGPCYHRLRNRGTLVPAYMPRTGSCSVDGCELLVEAKGFCQKHYYRQDDAEKNTWKLLRSRWKGQYPVAWDSFEAFVSEVGRRPGPKHQLRRINSREPWGKENIRWTERIMRGRSSGMSRDERLAYGREWKLKNKYNITGAEYDAMLARQGGACAICGDEKAASLAVDHCHQTGKVRGLLCVNCNRGIGYFLDQPERLTKAAQYLSQ